VTATASYDVACTATATYILENSAARPIQNGIRPKIESKDAALSVHAVIMLETPLFKYPLPLSTNMLYLK
jgi:hypothetical protein